MIDKVQTLISLMKECDMINDINNCNPLGSQNCDKCNINAQMIYIISVMNLNELALSNEYLSDSEKIVLGGDKSIVEIMFH
jgi:hypothetical protein